ncbi:unnamed protein product, partial [Ectocarpus sp. 12 AP-2014]
TGAPGGGGGSFLSARKLEDSRRGTAPPCDTLVPPGPHAPAYDIPNNPRSLLGMGSTGGGGGGGSDRFVAHDFKPVSMAPGETDGSMFGSGGGDGGGGGGGRGDMPRAKRARVMKREADGIHL